MVQQSSGITVTAAELDHITCSVSPSSVTAGDQTTGTATGYDAYNNSLGAVSASWSIENEAQGSWLSNVYTSQYSGTWTITATYLGKESTCQLTVNNGALHSVSVTLMPTSVTAGDIVTGTATGHDSQGNNLGTQTAEWSIEEDAGGSWNNNLYTSQNSGIWTVTATVSGIQGTTSLTVNPGDLFTISVSLSPSTITAGETSTGTATGYDNQGNNLGTQTATWSIENGANGNWLANVYTSQTSGVWTVTATVGTIEHTATLTVNNGPLNSLSVSISPSSVIAGNTATGTAVGYDAQGNNLGSQTATWGIDSAAGGSWDNNIYTSRYSGTWNVTATVSGIQNVTTLTVTNGALDRITCSLSPSTVIAGDTATGTAVGWDAQGNNLGVVSALWSIDSGAGGSWDNNVYTSQNVGTWTATASYSGKQSTTPLTVNAGILHSLVVFMSPSTVTAGATSTGTAIGYDDQGNSLGAQTAIWGIESGASGTWDNNVYTSKYSGAWTVTATVGAIEGTTVLTVNNGPLASVSVSLSPNSVTAGNTVTCTATGYDSQGNNLGLQSAFWSIESGAGGSWSDHIYTSKYAGTWDVTANVSGIIGTASLEVNPGALASLSVSLSKNKLTAGETTAGSAIGYDNQGNNLGTQTAEWTINSEASGNWLNNEYTSKYAGSWTVTATVSGIQGTTALDVIPGPLHSLSISMSPSSITAGATSEGTAIGYDSQGNNLGAQTVTWSIQAGAGGSWTNGVYSSQNAGTWTVTATALGVEGTTTLTVNSAALHSLSVTLSTSTITAGATTTATAIGYDVHGNNLGPQTVVWSIQSSAGGTWSGNTYASKYAGTWTVTALASGIEGTATLTVNVGSLDHITCSINPSTVTAGETSTGTVTAWDNQGNSRGTVTAVWSIQSGAGGNWDSNVYTSQNAGTWIVTATYNDKTATASLMVNAAPTPTPTATPTPNPTVSATQTPSATQSPSTTATPTASPSPKPTVVPSVGPTSTTIRTTTSNGQPVDITVSGNITSSQITRITITSDSDTKTAISFTLTGESGTTGFANLVIPKTAIPYGEVPTVYIGDQPAQNQGYTQDKQNFYVWFTTHFSTHQVEISFITPESPLAAYSLWFLLFFVAFLSVASVSLVVEKHRLKRKSD
jgi:cell division septation protein DedD